MLSDRAIMIERRPFDQLPSKFTGGLKTTRHFVACSGPEVQRAHQCCMHQWNDEEIFPETGFPLQNHANVEIIIYVREGTLTHTDNLSNEGRVEAGHIQVISAGSGIRNAEYNLERTTAKIFRLWITPASPGGAPPLGRASLLRGRAVRTLRADCQWPQE
jgi:redox-sensitive bicupin YhaK (pirin superfamily)